ncbi:MAG: RNA-binding S4 domain-containing protein [Pygmaiobacter sp.]
MEREKCAIHTEYIKLGDLLKFSNLLPSGGEAKLAVQDGVVFVNEVVCTMRGKKIRPGDVVRIEDYEVEVTAE